MESSRSEAETAIAAFKEAAQTQATAADFDSIKGEMGMVFAQVARVALRVSGGP